jgi:hypothetical protein
MMFQGLARMFLLGRSRSGRVGAQAGHGIPCAVKCDQICESKGGRA